MSTITGTVLVSGRQVEIDFDSEAGDYQSSQALRPGQDIPVVIADVEVGRIAMTSGLP